MRVGVATICCKYIESKYVGESTLSQGSLGFPIVLTVLKKTLSALLTKTIGWPRDPRDKVGGRHKRVLFNFPRIFKEDFQSYMVRYFSNQGLTRGSTSANDLPF